VSEVSLRGSSGDAATVVPQVALICAPLTVSIGSGRFGRSCTVTTRPSRLKRTPRSTSVATTTASASSAGRPVAGRTGNRRRRSKTPARAGPSVSRR
jgi:hypothetical protein